MTNSNNFGPPEDDRSVDIYHSDFGDGVRGTTTRFDHDKGKAHTSVYGDGAHFSWDTDLKTGEVDKVHGTKHGPDGKNPW